MGFSPSPSRILPTRIIASAPKKLSKRAASWAVVQFSKGKTSSLRSPLLLLHFVPSYFAFFFFVFSFGAVRGRGWWGWVGVFGFFVVVFFLLSWVLFFLLLLFLLPLPRRSVLRLRSGSAVLVLRFPPLPFGLGFWLRCPLRFLFRAAALVVCAVWLGPLFLLRVCSSLPLLVVVGVRSQLVLLRSFVLLLRLLRLCGFLFLLSPALLVLFRRLCRGAASRGSVRVRGLLLRSRLGRAFLRSFGCLLGLFPLLPLVLFRWAVVFSSARSSL